MYRPFLVRLFSKKPVILTQKVTSCSVKDDLACHHWAKSRQISPVTSTVDDFERQPMTAGGSSDRQIDSLTYPYVLDGTAFDEPQEF